jgi:hypothetical protein
MKKTHILIGLVFMGLILFIGGCVVAPPYDERRGYYGDAGNVIIHEPPLFLYPPSLGFYAAIGIPYDLFYIDRSYYLHNGNNWYRSSRYNGPWGSMRYDSLPNAFRKHRYNDIVRGRENEYRSYQEERNRYNGRSFRPERYEHHDR